MKYALTRWPRLGLGCASLGTPPPLLDDDDAEAVIHAAIERGIRFFDVAPLYGGGLAEERLGRALAALPRDEYTLCTKVGVTRPYGQSAMPHGATRRRQFDRWDYSAAATRVSIQSSLGRLATDRLDVVHLHEPRGLPGRHRLDEGSPTRQHAVPGLPREGPEGLARAGEGLDGVALGSR